MFLCVLHLCVSRLVPFGACARVCGQAVTKKIKALAVKKLLAKLVSWDPCARNVIARHEGSTQRHLSRMCMCVCAGIRVRCVGTPSEVDVGVDMGRYFCIGNMALLHLALLCAVIL